MNDYIFINKDIEILEGERAKEMLKNKSDDNTLKKLDHELS